jgi:hypothetical protein
MFHAIEKDGVKLVLKREYSDDNGVQFRLWVGNGVHGYSYWMSESVARRMKTEKAIGAAYLPFLRGNMRRARKGEHADPEEFEFLVTAVGMLEELVERLEETKL